ncbi:hypothetical protein PHAVU_009G123800 [Phaseolus vulgaris]|uniref:Uncharacterized protein n=1 Tax=Phaseolus vulgaris TaxID=3885 RepID=V7AXQ8_PHAVU|nr:hypothetical protein PHAVU_009G123800g [Phaseolus vulgaris]ESW09393.1 hypothetical protein PHAVU_009G123800g [Phaseolus vulgaris]
MGCWKKNDEMQEEIPSLYWRAWRVLFKLAWAWASTSGGKGKDCSDPTPPSPTTKKTETQLLPITSSHI